MLDDKKHQSEEEQRSYFRIDDVISVVANPVNLDNAENADIVKATVSSKSISLNDVNSTDDVAGDGDYADNPAMNRLFNAVSEVKTKIDFIINHLMLEKEGLLSSEKKFVNISASGIRFIVDHPAKEEEIMEIKLLLPTYPPVAIFAYGEVKRVKEIGDGKYEISIEYLNMGDSVRNEIIQYTLAQQREMIRKFKEVGDNE